MRKKKEITVLEFRCGTADGLTVQDVLPPSMHPDTGMPYRWGGKVTGVKSQKSRLRCLRLGGKS